MKKMTSLLLFMLTPLAAHALWNGQMASANMFRATLFLENCTAVKVASNTLLTAAHCVVEERGNERRVRDTHQVGQNLFVGYGVRPKGLHSMQPEIFDKRIVEIHVHDSYLNDQSSFVDIALIKFETAFPEHILSAKFFEEELEEEMPLIIGGYGGTHGDQAYPGMNGQGFVNTQREFRTGLSPLHYAQAKLDMLIGPDMQIRGPGTRNDFLGQEPLLWHGDSGGPVYLDDGEYLTVLAINSRASTLAIDSTCSLIANSSYFSTLDWIKRLIP